MKKTVISLLIGLFVTLSAQARPQATDYMACSLVDNGNYVAITAIPQSYLTSMGREEAIARRTCDSKLVKGGFGWATEYDCTKTMKVMRSILRQLIASGSCPEGGDEID